MDINKYRNLEKDLSDCLQSLDSHKITERKVIFIDLRLICVVCNESVRMVITLKCSYFNRHGSLLFALCIYHIE